MHRTFLVWDDVVHGLVVVPPDLELVVLHILAGRLVPHELLHMYRVTLNVLSRGFKTQLGLTLFL